MKWMICVSVAVILVCVNSEQLDEFTHSYCVSNAPERLTDNGCSFYASMRDLIDNQLFEQECKCTHYRCVDQDKNCQAMAETGRCTNKMYQRDMAITCKHTCYYCSYGPEWGDKCDKDISKCKRGLACGKLNFCECPDPKNMYFDDIARTCRPKPSYEQRCSNLDGICGAGLACDSDNGRCYCRDRENHMWKNATKKCVPLPGDGQKCTNKISMGGCKEGLICKVNRVCECKDPKKTYYDADWRKCRPKKGFRQHCLKTKECRKGLTCSLSTEMKVGKVCMCADPKKIFYKQHGKCVIRTTTTTTTSATTHPYENCYPEARPELYRGKKAVAKDGTKCYPWKSYYRFNDRPANYCRSKGVKYAPWCYRTGWWSWEYCDIPTCEELAKKKKAKGQRAMAGDASHVSVSWMTMTLVTSGWITWLVC